MENLAQIKRKHFRFPAFDDELGVKLTPENKRKLFQNDPMLNKNGTVSTPVQDSVSPMSPVDNYTEKQLVETNKQHVYHSQEQMKELAQHKSNLPDYSASRPSTSVTKKKTNLFGSTPKNKSNEFRTRETSRPSKTNTSRNYSYGNRSYFVPKYIPASVIPEETKASVSEHELAAAMKKEKSSYLLFDEEPSAFQVKEEKDPTVKKFNIPKESPEIPVTRRQYQQIKPDMERFGKGDISHSLPRSRKELKSAKENAKSQTAYGQKVAEAEQEKRRGILDKSLSGIIEDSSSNLENSKYFN